MGCCASEKTEGKHEKKDIQKKEKKHDVKVETKHDEVKVETKTKHTAETFDENVEHK